MPDNETIRESGQSAYIAAMKNVPTFEQMQDSRRNIEVITEDIRNLREEIGNLHRQSIWSDILTDLHESLESVQPGDTPDKWKQDFISKGYEISAITSDAYDKNVAENTPKIKEFVIGSRYGEEVKRTPKDILRENDDYIREYGLDYCDPGSLEKLAENGISAFDMDSIIYPRLFFRGPSDAHSVAKITEQYFGDTVPEDDKLIMSGILSKTLGDLWAVQSGLDDYENPKYNQQEIDFLAKIIANESGFNVAKINPDELWDEKLMYRENEYIYDPLICWAFDRIQSSNYGDPEAADKILQKAKEYAENPESAQIQRVEPSSHIDGISQAPELARPDQKRIIIDKVDEHYPYTMIVDRRMAPPKMKEVNGFSYSPDVLPNTERVGFAEETKFDNETLDASEAIDFALKELFSSNTFSGIEQKSLSERCVEKYPDVDKLLGVSSSIEQVLSGMKTKTELEAEMSQKKATLRDKEIELRSSQIKVEEMQAAEEKLPEVIKNSQEYKILSNFNKSLDFEGYGGIKEENLYELAERLLETGHFEKVLKKFGEEGMKRIVLEHSLTLLSSGEDDYNVAINLFNDLEALSKAYCSERELSEDQKRMMYMAETRINMLPLYQEEVPELFSDKYDNDILAKMVRSSLGIDQDLMKQLLFGNKE